MKYLITHILNSKEKQAYEKAGLFCYDLRDDDLGQGIASIEKHVLANLSGSMITNEEIKFGENPLVDDFVDYKTFISKNRRVKTVHALLGKQKRKER